MKAINVKVEEELWESMKSHEEINWSGLIRNSIKEKLFALEEKKFDKKEAQGALASAKAMRKEKAFTGRAGAEIIREWRDQRR